MRLYFRKNGWAYLEVSRNKSLALHTQDRDNAEAQKIEIEHRITQAKLDQLENTQKPDSITISGLEKVYCERTKGKKVLSLETIKKDRLTLKLFREAVGDLPLHKITEKHVDDFEKVCRSRKRTQGYITDEGMASYLRTLKAALNWAASARKKLMPKAPDFIMPVADKKPLEFRLIKKKDIKRLIIKAGERDKVFGVLIDFYANTGARRREGLGLLVERAALKGKHPSADVIGKGRKHRRLYIPPHLVARLKLIAPKEGRMFTDWHPDTVSHWFAACAKELVLPCRLHDLRHTWITRMLERGVPVEMVQVLAGHEKIETTMLYVHILEDIRARATVEKAYKKHGKM